MKKFLKILSLVLSLVMVLTFAACSDKTTNSTDSGSKDNSSGDDANTANVDVWDGSIASGVSEGSGTQEDPYVIYIGSELAYAVNGGAEGGIYYRLANDIYLNDVSDPYWMLVTTNNHWNTAATFDGIIDGNGHCIYGLWIDNVGRPDDGGLVSNLKKGGFKNLGIRYSYVSAKNYAGAFAGRVSGGMSFFKNCFVDETVYVQYTDMGRNGVGGITGYACSGGSLEPTLEFENCYSKANILGLGMVERANGIIGTTWNSAYTMKNCYSVGYAPYFAKNLNTASALLSGGWKAKDVYVNNYTDKREKAKMEEWTLLASDKMATDMKLDFENTFEQVKGATPKLKVFTDLDGKAITNTVEVPYYRYMVMEFGGGLGTAEDPYIISNADQLRYVVTGYWADTYFKMSNDIHINETGNPNWTANAVTWEQSSSNCFGGNFDGGGFAVYGLYYNDNPGTEQSDYGVGLFPKISTSAVIKNVKIKNANLKGYGSAGCIAGTMVDLGKGTSAVISDCSAENVVLKAQTTGDMVGLKVGAVEITNCTFN